MPEQTKNYFRKAVTRILTEKRRCPTDHEVAVIVTAFYDCTPHFFDLLGYGYGYIQLNLFAGDYERAFSGISHPKPPTDVMAY